MYLPPFENMNSPNRWHMRITFFLSYINFALRFQNFSVGVNSWGTCNLTVVSALCHGADSQYEILLKVILTRIPRLRLQFATAELCKWSGLHDSARLHTAIWVKKFFAQNRHWKDTNFQEFQIPKLLLLENKKRYAGSLS